MLVLDSVGIGALPDAALYGDQGSHTLRACWNTGKLSVPTLQALGLFQIDGVACGQPVSQPRGAFGRLQEVSAGKDTTIGHWELAGVISDRPLPTYPQGFPSAVIAAFEQAVGRGTLCNKPYAGTQVLLDYGPEHLRTGKLIIYTSADSVFQIAAHEELIPVPALYQVCETARRLLTGIHGVGRVIARPFVGTYPTYTRTSNRHDYSLPPPAPTVLEMLSASGLDVIGVGKIGDIFAGRGLTQSHRTHGNDDGMDRTIDLARQSDWTGLCFVNLVDFDMLYGHRNDPAGYTAALNRFDERLAELLTVLRPDDTLLITADHGCDPSTPSTDHSREYVPLLAYGAGVSAGVNLGTCPTFADVGKTVAALLGVDATCAGHSLLPWLAGTQEGRTNA